MSQNISKKTNVQAGAVEKVSAPNTAVSGKVTTLGLVRASESEIEALNNKVRAGGFGRTSTIEPELRELVKIAKAEKSDWHKLNHNSGAVSRKISELLEAYKGVETEKSFSAGLSILRVTTLNKKNKPCYVRKLTGEEVQIRENKQAEQTA